MPIRSLYNQYHGINPHLHSQWQAEEGWQEFHTAHLSDLNKLLKRELRPLGYTSSLEPSVQIRRNGEISKPEADVGIFDTDPIRPLYRPKSLISSETIAAEAILPIPEWIYEENPISEKNYQAVAIYEWIAKDNQKGELVAWIELLSPSNKKPRSDGKLYLSKREKLLRHQIVFIELDYLHESPPTFPRLTVYPEQLGSHPYRIAVMDPRPDFSHSQGYVREFDVDDPIPTMIIPLNGEDQFTFDFGIPYRKTYEEMLYGLESVDYHTLPIHFQRYSPADQARILGRLLAVIEAEQQGQTLPQTPLPRLEVTDLMASWERFKALT